jgi:hypothetical protein
VTVDRFDELQTAVDALLLLIVILANFFSRPKSS